MSAAAKPWKVQENQDRRSNMVHSSVNAPSKKDGAGGSYTWGGAMDITDYEPKGVGNVTKVVTVAPTAAPVQVAQLVQGAAVPQGTPVPISDSQQFPALGAPSPQPLASPTTSVRWGPPSVAVQQAAVVTTQTAPAVQVQSMAAVPVQIPSSVKMPPAQATTVTTTALAGTSSQAVSVSTTAAAAQVASTTVASPVLGGQPRVVVSQDMLRPGLATLDATHPRNTFARKPYHKTSVGTTASGLQDAIAIDWSAAGTTSFQHQVIHNVANPAHLGPYVEPKPGVSLSTLQAMPSPAAYIPNPKLSKQVNAGVKFGKPQVMFQRKC
mmetsp:Transcript_21539/g.50180  ORF Transcript_21539/g.50180 Transcript_21539/m.50180 type:complete len:324 (+) Transcript_21539:69-1040(+)